MQGTMHCHKCGAAIKLEAIVCIHCGLPNMYNKSSPIAQGYRLCLGCGVVIYDSYRACVHCGRTYNV